jgi:hypothetical protein
VLILRYLRYGVCRSVLGRSDCHRLRTMITLTPPITVTATACEVKLNALSRVFMSMYLHHAEADPYFDQQISLPRR